nr:Uncharacterised protein [Raoultella sp. NCTC 9187]
MNLKHKLQGLLCYWLTAFFKDYYGSAQHSTHIIVHGLVFFFWLHSTDSLCMSFFSYELFITRNNR